MAEFFGQSVDPLAVLDVDIHHVAQPQVHQADPRAGQGGADAAATVVADHHDVLDLQHVHRELDELPGERVADSALVQRESALRDTMNGFTHLRPLRVGDVVVVPLRLPHALQHGVRTIEFQTPVYERQILSFAQRVVTQDHWDTPAAVEQMLLRPPPEQAFDCLFESAGARVERIVDFPDFEVRRVRIECGGGVLLAPLRDYALAMVVEGTLALAGQVYGAEQAVLLPRAWEGVLSAGKPAQPLTLLLALPR